MFRVYSSTHVAAQKRTPPPPSFHHLLSDAIFLQCPMATFARHFPSPDVGGSGRTAAKSKLCHLFVSSLSSSLCYFDFDLCVPFTRRTISLRHTTYFSQTKEQQQKKEMKMRTELTSISTTTVPSPRALLVNAVPHLGAACSSLVSQCGNDQRRCHFRLV